MFDFKKMIRFFVYAGCKDETEYQSILPEIHKTNIDIFRIVTATLTFLMFSLIVFTTINKFYYDFSLNYFFILGFAVIFTLLVWFLPNRYVKVHQFLLYSFFVLSFFFGIINGIMIPEINAVGFIVILITMPLLFIDRPIRIIFISLTAMACFTLAVIMFKPYDIIVFDTTNIVIYGSFSIVLSSHIIHVKVSKLLADKKLLILSETDLLTGLRNRNSYEENLSSYPFRSKKSLTCIYLDANGLHELNNTRGHKAGDDMLCTIADFLKEYFLLPDIYRIGGDEFVVFVMDDDNAYALNSIQEISNRLTEQDYHVSWGLSTHSSDQIDIHSLIIETEQKMYKAKSMYYTQRGIDRRRTR